MPKGSNQKVKLYYLAKIMVEKTDDEHSLTLPEIVRYLEEQGYMLLTVDELFAKDGVELKPNRVYYRCDQGDTSIRKD